MSVEWFAVEAFRKGMIKVGRFVLTSGLESPFYIDLRKLYSYPAIVQKLVDELIERFNLRRFEGVAGVATAGIALASYIASKLGVPMGYVRSERKEHGTQSVVEGDLEGLRIVIVDDVATTGGSIERAYHALREIGANPVAALVIVDREQGARERLARLGLPLYAYTTARQIFEVLRRRGLVDEQTYERILAYLARVRG